MTKDVVDVGSEYERNESAPAADADIRRIKSKAERLRTGRVEKDVDRLLAAKGLPMNEAVEGPKTRLRA